VRKGAIARASLTASQADRSLRRLRAEDFCCMSISAAPPRDPAREPELVPPPPRSVADLVMADGAVIRLRRHGNPSGPRLALSHGNGLAIEAYYPFWRLLLARYDVVLFDQRNHGENPLHGAGGHHWPNFVRDSGAVFQGIQQQFGPKRTIGLFHSLSSVAALAATLAEGPLWDPLILVDPPIFPPPGHSLEALELEHMTEMAAIARRRPERYADPHVFAGQLAAREVFSRWVPGAHLALARTTLRLDGARGDWVLRCPRELEARVFETNIDPTLWPRIGRCPVPVLLVGADPSLPYAQQTPARLTAALAEDQGIPYASVPETTHFLAIERPDQVWAPIEAFLARQGLAPA
jgi:pimeloyl-ACP methyl ester carboxylesterase